MAQTDTGVIDGNAPNNDWHRGPGNASADGKHFAPFYSNFWHMCRPRMVEFRWVKNATIEDVTIRNSIMFNVHTAHASRLRSPSLSLSLPPVSVSVWDCSRFAPQDLERDDSLTRAEHGRLQRGRHRHAHQGQYLLRTLWIQHTHRY